MGEERWWYGVALVAKEYLSDVYLKILENDTVPTGRGIIKDGFVYQLDIYPNHI